MIECDCDDPVPAKPPRGFYIKYGAPVICCGSRAQDELLSFLMVFRALATTVEQVVAVPDTASNRVAVAAASKQETAPPPTTTATTNSNDKDTNDSNNRENNINDNSNKSVSK